MRGSCGEDGEMLNRGKGEREGGKRRVRSDDRVDVAGAVLRARMRIECEECENSRGL